MDWITTTTILHDLADYSNRSAWERFAARFRGPIERFGCRMGLSPADAEDMAQDTLIAFAEGLRKGQYERAKGRLSHWLFGIAFRQALSKRRVTARHGAAANRAESSDCLARVPAKDSLTAIWEQEWEQALTELCLERVRQEVEPASMRAFELVMLHGRTPAKAAYELGVPTKAAYNAKYTILKRMRRLRTEMEEES